MAGGGVMAMIIRAAGVHHAARVAMAATVLALAGCAQPAARPAEDASPYLAAHICTTGFFPAHCLSASNF